jgi:hypothetical protein
VLITEIIHLTTQDSNIFPLPSTCARSFPAIGGEQVWFLIRDEHRHHFAGAIKKALTHALDSPYGSKSADCLHFFS